eukprot:418757_1
MNTVKNEIINQLLELGYNQQEITKSINNVRERLLWTVGSTCLVYSRKYKTWFCDGQIINLIKNKITHEIWLNVHYNQQMNNKKMQRFNKNIQPYDIDNSYNHKIIQIISHKLKQYNTTDLYKQIVSKKLTRMQLLMDGFIRELIPLLNKKCIIPYAINRLCFQFADFADFRNEIDIKYIPISEKTIQTSMFKAACPCADNKSIFIIDIISGVEKCWIYELITEKMREISIPKHFPSGYHTIFNVFKLINYKFLICADVKQRNISEGNNSVIYIYDSKKNISIINQWKRLKTPECSIRNCCLNSNGELHVVDKKLHYKYNFEYEKWYELKNIPWTLQDNGGFVLGPDGYLYYFGGCDWTGHNPVPIRCVFIYKNNEWIKGSDMPIELGEFGYCATGSQIVVIGGIKRKPPHSDAIYVYDFVSGKWCKSDECFKLRGISNVVCYCNYQIHCFSGIGKPKHFILDAFRTI